MKCSVCRGAVSALVLAFAVSAKAHFMVIGPSADIVDDVSKPLDIKLIFTHPAENGPAMEMASPVQFGVLASGGKEDLLKTLKAVKVQGATAYETRYNVKKPGDYVFYVEPAPYWEPAENKYITHYAKVVVDALGEEEGWDAMVGFPVEIEPLVRPYGLWAGNCFRGVVRRDGKPVPFATVEVERLNDRPGEKVPSGPFVTQVIKADAQGVFTYVMPKAGWWGFAALVDGAPSQKDGKPVGVELGGLIWVKCEKME